MILKVAPRWTTVSLALLLGLLLTVSLLTGMALAQKPDKEKGIETQVVEGETYWLILDSARPVDEILPPLLDVLTALKANGALIDFDPAPQASAPTAVPGVRVVVAPGRQAMLRSLPGVLDVSATLPPPPPGGLGILGTTGSITGQVTEAGSGAPLNSIYVAVYDAISFAWIGYNWTDADGMYTLTVTAPYSQAKVLFNQSQYAQQWYNNKAYFSVADQVNVNGVVTNINAALVKNGVISGTVTHEGGGPIESVTANIYNFNGDMSYGNWTDVNGQFLTSVPSGTYRIWFSGDIVGEWYQDKTSVEQANLVTVTNGMTTSITAQVTRTGVITGVVTDAATSLPLEDIQVKAYQSNSTWSTWTDTEGQYTLNLPPGNYQVRFKHPVLGYVTQYYNNKANQGAADAVTVNPGVTTPNINAALVSATGRISGAITKNGGNPLAAGEEVDVDLYDAATGEYLVNWPYLHFAGDGVKTTYVFTVAPGAYKVRFDTYDDYLAYEWYDNQTSKSRANVVTITAGAVTSNINADLAVVTPTVPGCITGTVTSGGLPLENAMVRLYEVEVDWYYSSATTDIDGWYEICDINSGNYQVSFSYFPSATTWYNGQVSRSAANTVTVTGGATQTVNGDIGVGLGGCISGKAAYLDGTAAESGVYIREASGQVVPAWFGNYDTYLGDAGWTDDDGFFVACGLQPGNYTVFLDDYDGQTGVATATATVAAGQSVNVGVVKISFHTYLPLVLKK